MSIGTTIKKLRRERNMTQEQLAEYLGITANAVSQWECDRTAPDISQLPMLSRILQVTTDRLLGVDFSLDKEEIERIGRESFDFYRVGQREKAIEIVRNGLKQYPQSFRLMARLAESLIGIPGCEEEIEELCDKILKDCTEGRPRDHAYRLKIILCGQRGQYGEVKKLAENLPHVWASQEELLLRWYHEDSEAHRIELVECAEMYLQSLTICLGHIALSSCYTVEEKFRSENKSSVFCKFCIPMRITVTRRPVWRMNTAGSQRCTSKSVNVIGRWMRLSACARTRLILKLAAASIRPLFSAATKLRSGLRTSIPTVGMICFRS